MKISIINKSGSGESESKSYVVETEAKTNLNLLSQSCITLAIN